MARGFGSTLGVGSTDTLLTKARAYTTTHTVSFWYIRNGAGGGGYGMPCASSNGFVYWHTGFAKMAVAVITTNGAFGYNLVGGTVSSTGVWNHLVVIFDTTAAANTLPVVYCNGVALTVTAQATETGTRLGPATQWYIGNDATNIQNWDGLVEDFAIFNGRLTRAQANALYRGADPRAVSVGSSRVDLQACKLEYSIVSPK